MQGPNPWLLLIILGALTTALGVWLIFSLNAALATVAILLAIGLFLNGLNELVWARERTSPWIGYALGVLFIVGGIVVIAQPGDSLRVLAIVIGAVLMTMGIFQMAAAIVSRNEVRHWIWMAIFGLITLGIGFMAIIWPAVTIRVLSIILAIRFLIVGIGSMWLGNEFRKVRS